MQLLSFTFATLLAIASLASCQNLVVDNKEYHLEEITSVKIIDKDPEVGPKASVTVLFAGSDGKVAISCESAWTVSEMLNPAELTVCTALVHVFSHCVQ